MKILYVTTVGMTMRFFESYFKKLIADGSTVELACNEQEWDFSDSIKALGLKTYHLDVSRSPFSSGNLKAIKQIKRLILENEYDIVHCHTPIAAACTRLACKDIRRKRQSTFKPLRVFYTAHGFHFYKGCPKANRIIYYPVERLCAKWTDQLITINKEDYALAKEKFEGLGRGGGFSGCRVEYVPGVGIDVGKFADVQIDRRQKRAELGIPEDATLLLSVGELNENKNQKLVINALAELLGKTEASETAEAHKEELPQADENDVKNYYYIIAGEGPLREELQRMIDSLDLADRVKLLGQRKDCPELYKAADLFVHPSFREGLPVSVMEALAAGLCCIGSRIRGNEDLMPPENLFSPNNTDELKEKILYCTGELKESILHGAAELKERPQCSEPGTESMQNNEAVFDTTLSKQASGSQNLDPGQFDSKNINAKMQELYENSLKV